MRIALLALFFAAPLWAGITQPFPWCPYAGGEIAPCVAPSSVIVQPIELSPAAPTVTVQGATGASTWSYAVSACDAIGCSTVGANGTVANGFAALDGTHFNRVVTPSVPGATSCDIYITVAPGGGTTGLIDSGNPCGATFNDHTGMGDGGSPVVNQTGGMFLADNLRVFGHTAFGLTSEFQVGTISVVSEEIDDTLLGNAGGINVNLYVDSHFDGALAQGLVFEVDRDENSDGNMTQSNGVIGRVVYDGGGMGNQVNGSILAVTSLHSSGTLDVFNGVKTSLQFQAAGTITDACGLCVDPSENSGGGTITNLFGLNISDQNVGVNNWAIKTGDGKVQLGDTVQLDSLASGTDSLPVCRHTDGTLYNGTNTAGVLACP
jgi:hypothetical protein